MHAIPEERRTGGCPRLKFEISSAVRSCVIVVRQTDRVDLILRAILSRPHSGCIRETIRTRRTEIELERGLEDVCTREGIAIADRDGIVQRAWRILEEQIPCDLNAHGRVLGGREL